MTTEAGDQVMMIENGSLVTTGNQIAMVTEDGTMVTQMVHNTGGIVTMGKELVIDKKPDLNSLDKLIQQVHVQWCPPRT